MKLLRWLWLLGLVGALLVPGAHARGWREQWTALDEVEAAALPPEARATLAAIRRGGPFAYAKDGIVFGNRERRLPLQRRGYYTEYTVRTPGERSRGARRIVAGGDPRQSGEYYYTDDHYQTFRRIRE